MAGLGEGASSALRIESSRDAAGDPLLKLSGELDLLAADSLRRAIDNALDAVPERLVFDVSELRFIDSAGLAVLIEASSRDGAVELRSPSAAVRRAVELTGLAEVLRLVG